MADEEIQTNGMEWNGMEGNGREERGVSSLDDQLISCRSETPVPQNSNFSYRAHFRRTSAKPINPGGCCCYYSNERSDKFGDKIFLFCFKTIEICRDVLFWAKKDVL